MDSSEYEMLNHTQLTHDRLPNKTISTTTKVFDVQKFYENYLNFVTDNSLVLSISIELKEKFYMNMINSTVKYQANMDLIDNIINTNNLGTFRKCKNNYK